MKNSIQKWGQTISQSSFLPRKQALGKSGIHLAANLNIEFQSTIRDFFWMVSPWWYEKPICDGSHRAVCGTLSRAESSHCLRWKSHIKTHIAAHSALLETSCATPVMNLHCELWFNCLISTLILVLAFVWTAATFISVMVTSEKHAC